MHAEQQTPRRPHHIPSWQSWPSRDSRGAVSEQFIRGLRQGLATCWHVNGRKAWEGRFVDGRESGWWAFWDEDGETIALVEYRAGRVSRTLSRDAEILAAAVARV
jgi:hypothetical protein